MIRRLRNLVLLVALLAVVAAGLASRLTLERPTLPARTGPPLSDAATWGYQLQRVRAPLIPDQIDVLVTDASGDGTGSGAWQRADLDRLKTRKGGKPRIVLAYLSIGEAERYRPYWRSHWRIAPPAWLGRENPDWRDNYAVRYWHPAWQALHVRPAPSVLRRVFEALMPGAVLKPTLDQIIEAGFDGVYLDRVDAFEDWGRTRPTAEKEMVEFVRTIGRYGRSRRPGFLVVPQNGETLLAQAEYRAAIDGIGKEDLFYGVTKDGIANTAEEVAAAIGSLDHATRAGLPVFLVEYVTDAGARTLIREEAARRGYRLTFARRALSLPPEIPPRDPPPQPAEAAPPEPAQPPPSQAGPRVHR